MCARVCYVVGLKLSSQPSQKEIFPVETIPNLVATTLKSKKKKKDEADLYPLYNPEYN